jgi:hypothetical protein
MSTGSVTPFTPTQPTQLLSYSTSSAALAFNAVDTLMLFNAGAVTVFVAFGETTTGLTAVAPTVGTPQNSMPIPAGQTIWIGTGYFGNGQNITAVAAIASGSGSLYITPGLGTQH